MRILVIVAHPDDIEFGAAGSVAQWTHNGDEVSYAIVTNGAAGSNDPTADPAALIAQRQAEQRAAAAHVGVTDVHFMGYADGTLTPTLELRRDLTRVIRTVKPDRVVTFDPTVLLWDEVGYINHPDHIATATAALYAVFPSSETRLIFPELLAEGLEPHKVSELYLMLSAKPNVLIDITPYFEQKIAALLEHKSQLGPEARAMIERFDGEVGKEINAQYAESFRVMRLNQQDAAAESTAAEPTADAT
jgi:LmbE family N-acetylglucosaminyl deacetylase